jgi:cell division protein FtsQ
MVAGVRGERSPATSRSKTASAARGAPQGRGRGPAPRDTAYKTPKSDTPTRGGLGPRLAVGIAVVVIAAGAAAAVFLAHRGEPRVFASAPTERAAAIARALAPLGFTLQQVQVQGAPELAKADILRAAGLAKGQPILGLNMDDLRKRIEAAGWVKEAKIVRLLPDTLVIAVTPRAPVAVWQHLGVAKVVDGEGKVIGDADPGRFPDLPLVVGEGAAEQVGAVLPLLRGRAKLMGLVDALIRVDGRRWDLRLKDGAIIQLPAVGEDSALIQLDQLDQKARVLDLGFERIDLRDPDMIAVRPKASAAPRAADAPAGTAQQKN